MSKNKDQQNPIQPPDLRAAMASSDATECTYRYAAITLGVAAAIIIVVTVREIDSHAAFGIGLVCALGALALAMHSRALGGQRVIAGTILWAYEHLNERLDAVEDTAGTAATGVDGVLRIIERSREDDGTGPQPVQRIGRP